MDMTIGKKEKDLLIGLAGVIVAVLVWFLVASPTMEKTEALKADNEYLRPRAEEYQAVYAKIEDYQGGIQALNDEKNDIISHFPSKVEREDQIMFWANLDAEYPTQAALRDIAISNDEVFYASSGNGENPNGITNIEEATSPDEIAAIYESTVLLYKAPINVMFDSTYVGLKDIIGFITAQSNKNAIDNMVIGFDSATGNLTGSIDINMFYITGTGKEYEQPGIPAPKTGISDVFHTSGVKLNLAANNAATADDADEDEEDSEE